MFFFETQCIYRAGFVCHLGHTLLWIKRFLKSEIGCFIRIIAYFDERCTHDARKCDFDFPRASAICISVIMWALSIVLYLLNCMRGLGQVCDCNCGDGQNCGDKNTSPHCFDWR